MEPSTYPVTITITPQAGLRNRLTTAPRSILAIPHAILAGPVYWSSRTGGAGLLGGAAYVMAIVSWFTLLITGEHFRGIRDFSLYYLRWRTRARWRTWRSSWTRIRPSATSRIRPRSR